MKVPTMKRAAMIVALVAFGYLVGAAAPSVHAYTQDETRLLNRISNDLSGINKSLAKIASKIK